MGGFGAHQEIRNEKGCQGMRSDLDLELCGSESITKTCFGKVQVSACRLVAGQKPPEAALAADKTSVVSAEKTSVASRAKTSVAAAEKTPDISMKSTTPWGGAGAPGCGG